MAAAAIEAQGNLHLVPVSAALAVRAAEIRRRYYTKKHAFSYNDGLYLATGVAEGAGLLISTDPHLLAADELKIVRPSQFR